MTSGSGMADINLADIKTIDGVDVAGKRVLVRADLNVPVDDGAVADATRIERVLPTIKSLTKAGAKVVLMSHFGRPKGERSPETSLKPVAAKLAELLRTDVQFFDDCVGPEIEAGVASLKDGDVALLENLRYHAGETKNDIGFAKQLAALGDVYVDDAFSCAHRAHASVEAIAHLMPAYAGMAMMAEINALSAALEDPKLPLEQAFPNYLSYKKESDAWILANFICPVNRLDELVSYKKLLQENNQSVFLTVLPEVSEKNTEYQHTFSKNIQDINHFLQKMGQCVSLNTLEIRISPAIMIKDHILALPHFLNGIFETLKSAGILNVKLFFELNQSIGWVDGVEDFIEQIARFNQHGVKPDQSTAFIPAGLKLRCGGDRAENVPSAEEVARTIHSCMLLGIPFKATAGLHHPVRHYDRGLETSVHGFLNIFGGALMAYQHRLTMADIHSIILEEDPAQFIFDDHLFRYKNLNMNSDQIQRLRRESVISFGSCSFDEPREDLIQLGLLH